MECHESHYYGGNGDHPKDRPTDRPIYGIRDKEMMFACKKIIEMEYR